MKLGDSNTNTKLLWVVAATTLDVASSPLPRLSPVVETAAAEAAGAGERGTLKNSSALGKVMVPEMPLHQG